jgi:hypothetical protein
MGDIPEHDSEKKRKKYYREDSGVYFTVTRLAVSTHDQLENRSEFICL